MRRIVVSALMLLTLPACASKGLRDLQNESNGPDEFLVEPVKPLESPSNYSTLPAPTPGQANLTDRSALNDGVIAFGGRPDAGGGAVPARDGALVQYTSRLGVMPGVRQHLAVKDAEFRKGKARFTQYRLVPTDRYSTAYRGEALDAEREAARWQRAGARTPSAPPPVR